MDIKIFDIDFIDNKLVRSYFKNMMLVNNSMWHKSNKGVENASELYNDSLITYYHFKLTDFLNFPKNVKPTFSYSRIYYPGNVLTKHTDRTGCKFGLLYCHYRSSSEPWYLNIENDKFDIPPGKALMFDGTTYEHWRDEYDGVAYMSFFFWSDVPREWFDDKQSFKEMWEAYENIRSQDR